PAPIASPAPAMDREAAIELASRQYRREALGTLGASVLGASDFAPRPRTYTFPGLDPVVCSTTLEEAVCR
ncbi:MAG: hypothetical protein ABW042_02010, partial [Phenylobacterium sp.]